MRSLLLTASAVLMVVSSAANDAKAQPEKAAKDCLLILPERLENSPFPVTDYYLHNTSSKTIQATVRKTYHVPGKPLESVVNEYTVLAGGKTIVASSGGFGGVPTTAEVTGASYK